MSTAAFEAPDHYTAGEGRWLGPDATQAAFPLGGIGTGNIALGARGNLRDFEIWNEPHKGLTLPFTFFSLWAKPEGGRSVTRVLEGRIPAPYPASHGIHPNMGGGLPRFAASRFRGRYPMAELELRDPNVPVQVDLLAYTPFVPLDADASGLPCALVRWQLTNTGSVPVQATVVGSMLNPVGFIGTDRSGHLLGDHYRGNQNSWRDDGSLRGVFFAGGPRPVTDRAYGNAALVTTAASTTGKPAWWRGAWFDTLQEFWTDLTADGRLNALSTGQQAQHAGVGPSFAGVDPGSVGALLALAPGETATVTFILSWYFPNRLNGWDTVAPDHAPTTRVRYAGRFSDAWDVARHVASNLPALEATTLRFRDALYGSTLPDAVVDALASTMVVMRSTTCFWLESGQFFGWEGCNDQGGCCSGNCTHVWNYAQAQAFLFPSLEASMLRTAFLDEVEESGKMRFRAGKVFDVLWHYPQAAADGQLGSIIRLWRAFVLTGNRTLLSDLWPAVQKTLRYALQTWDRDQDGVLEGAQHNTYDIEFYGPNPLTGVMLLGALKAAEAMAAYLREPALAEQYRALRERSGARLDGLLWTGEYYRQVLDDLDAHHYQHGEGCLSDQLLGQLLAQVAQLGYLLPPERVQATLEAIYKYNFRQPLGEHTNLQRAFAFADESGLILCSWPAGGRPLWPFVYSDEVWTGVEYHVAAHLIYEGYVLEGLTLVSAVRSRHDGYRRNPWDEVECGHHYARSMASWALLPALSGFRCDLEQKVLSFAPRIHQRHFRTLFACGAAWGVYEHTEDTEGLHPSLQVLGGTLDGFLLDITGQQWRIVGDQLIG